MQRTLRRSCDEDGWFLLAVRMLCTHGGQRVFMPSGVLCRLYTALSLYSALSIYRGHISLNISRKTRHSSPVRVRYGVSFVNTKSD